MVPLCQNAGHRRHHPLKSAVSAVASTALYARLPGRPSGVSPPSGPTSCSCRRCLRRPQLDVHARGPGHAVHEHHVLRLQARNIAMAIAIVPISFVANIVRVCILVLVTYHHFGDEAGQALCMALPAWCSSSWPDLILAFDHGMTGLARWIKGWAGHEHAPHRHLRRNSHGRLRPWPSGRGPPSACLTCTWLPARTGATLPKALADGMLTKNMPVVVPPPDQQAVLEQDLQPDAWRTYVDAKGPAVSCSPLPMAETNPTASPSHVPDVCYASQGFKGRTGP